MSDQAVAPQSNSDGTDEELVSRFYRVLVESIRETAPSYLSDRFTVADIYQFLIPYRTHRDRLGVSMSGDYQDTLLRLLAGEGDLIVLESEPVRERIRDELESRNPNTGIYREFAAAEVRLNSGRVPLVAEALSPPEGEEMKPKEVVTVTTEVTRPVELRPEKERRESGKPGGVDGSAADCPECKRALPDRDTVNFCPHCGANIREAPCQSCGESLGREWGFCIACGASSQSPSGS